MTKKNKAIIGCILICLFCFMGVYYYVNNNQENNFDISHVSGNADTKMWTDNSQNNIYDIKFQIFDGTDLKEITSKKSTYNMNIDSNVDNGELNIKIYNDDKVLFE
jgi:molecular chaperone DnaK (HSP70)